MLPDIGLYQPEIVKRLQQRFEWAPTAPDLHVEELLFVILAAWTEKTDLLDRDDFFVEFRYTPFGDRLRILAPVVKYQEEAARLRWWSSPRPYRSDKEVRFKGETA